MKLFLVAQSVVQSLAGEIWRYGDCQANWRLIDRIERRWRLHGCALQRIESLERAAAKAAKAKQ